jgi:hypothetical protein
MLTLLCLHGGYCVLGGLLLWAIAGWQPTLMAGWLVGNGLGFSNTVLFFAIEQAVFPQLKGAKGIGLMAGLSLAKLLPLAWLLVWLGDGNWLKTGIVILGFLGYNSVMIINGWLALKVKAPNNV